MYLCLCVRVCGVGRKFWPVNFRYKLNTFFEILSVHVYVCICTLWERKSPVFTWSLRYIVTCLVHEGLNWTLHPETKIQKHLCHLSVSIKKIMLNARFLFVVGKRRPRVIFTKTVFCWSSCSQSDISEIKYPPTDLQISFKLFHVDETQFRPIFWGLPLSKNDAKMTEIWFGVQSSWATVWAGHGPGGLVLYHRRCASVVWVACCRDGVTGCCCFFSELFFADLLFFSWTIILYILILASYVFAYWDSSRSVLSLQSFYNYARGHCENARNFFWVVHRFCCSSVRNSKTALATVRELF